MEDLTPDELRTRLSVIEARLADLERGPTPSLRGHEGTYSRIVSDHLFQAAIGSTDEESDPEARVSAALWAVQVVARELDDLRGAVGDALHSPGSRPNPN